MSKLLLFNSLVLASLLIFASEGVFGVKAPKKTPVEGQ